MTDAEEAQPGRGGTDSPSHRKKMRNRGHLAASNRWESLRMTETPDPAKPASHPWRPRFSLRTLVLGVLVYASLWTVTEIRGGKDFRARIESRCDALTQATSAWARSEAREADLWSGETAAGFEQAQKSSPNYPPSTPAGEDEAAVSSFCSTETLAVAPFVLRVDYTYACTDAAGRSLPPGLLGTQPADGHARGWALWCFGYVFQIGGGV